MSSSNWMPSRAQALLNILEEIERRIVDMTYRATGTEGAGTTFVLWSAAQVRFASYTGEETQQFLGFNKTGGVNLRVTIKLRKTTAYR
jgi:hypothetical protein